MPLITLSSDLGLKDNYVALVKAELLKNVEQAAIIDISHDIEKFNLTHAAYIFGNAYTFFPENTYHLVGVKSQNTAKRLLYIEINNQKIICLDNGFITLLPQSYTAKVFYLEGKEFEAGLFFLKDAMVKALNAVINTPAVLKPCNTYEQLVAFQPSATPYSITGRGLHVDSFGNVVTNITQTFFEEVCKNRSFTIHLPGLQIDEIVSNYDDVSENTALALFNTFGYLEIAINRQNASQMLFHKSSNSQNQFGITIQFED